MGLATRISLKKLIRNG